VLFVAAAASQAATQALSRQPVLPVQVATVLPLQSTMVCMSLLQWVAVHDGLS